MKPAPLSESQFFLSFDASVGVGTKFVLNAEESNHAVKVFRHRVGDLLRVGNGEGIQGVARVTQVSAQACEVEIDEVYALQSKPRIHLAIAALKDNDLEEVMEACGQLELASMTLLRTAHSQEPKDSDLKRTVRRLELKSLVAFKQSLKAWTTLVYGPVPLAQWLDTQTNQLLLCDLGGDRALVQHALQSQTELTVVVGPEGGFSPSEVESMRKLGAVILTLGSTRLRAKTCPAIALGALLGMNY